METTTEAPQTKVIGAPQESEAPKLSETKGLTSVKQSLKKASQNASRKVQEKTSGLHRGSVSGGFAEAQEKAERIGTEVVGSAAGTVRDLLGRASGILTGALTALKGISSTEVMKDRIASGNAEKMSYMGIWIEECTIEDKPVGVRCALTQDPETGPLDDTEERIVYAANRSHGIATIPTQDGPQKVEATLAPYRKNGQRVGFWVFTHTDNQLTYLYID